MEPTPLEKPTLYQIAPSFYSQLARLALVEKGVSYREMITVVGPPLFESYAPAYMVMNPMGTVPVMVHGEVVLPDSREILAYVEQTFEGPALIPAVAEARAGVERWVEALYAISVRDLTYGDPEFLATGARLNRMRVSNLQRHARANPELRELYEGKLRDLEDFRVTTQDPARVAAEREGVMACLDQLDASFAARGPQAFVAGEDYSLADVVWTVGVARFLMLELDPLAGRPALASWYGRMRERPSFAAARVWERTDRGALAVIMARKLGPYLVLGLAALALVAAGLWWGVQAAS